MTCDNWPWIMWDTYNARGSSAFVLFPLIIILGNFVALNLFLAILLAEFADDRDAREHAKTTRRRQRWHTTHTTP